MAITLPIYELEPARIDACDLSRIAADLLGLAKLDPAERGARLAVADDRFTVELFPASGTIHALRRDRLRLAGQLGAVPTGERP